MLYQKKRRKLNLIENNDKKHEDSTQNSDRMPSSQKTSQLSRNKKSFTKLFTKRISDKEKQEKQSSLERIHNAKVEEREERERGESQMMEQIDIVKKSTENVCSQQEIEKQKATYQTTNSTCSLQLNNNPDSQDLKSKKKFKLYCQVKKKKQNQNQKKSQYQKQTDKFGASSTVSESWMKNSIFSKNSDRNGSNSTNKSRKQKSLKRKIDLTEKIKQIRNQEKEKQQQEKQQKVIEQKKQQTPCEQKQNILASKLLHLQLKDNTPTSAKKSSQSSKRSQKSLQKKHSTVNIKRSTILSRLATKKQQTKTIISSSQQQQQQQSIIEIKSSKLSSSIQQSHPSSIISLKKLTTSIQNKILPQDSQILQQSVNKLSQIKQYTYEDTISRSLKTNNHSMDGSTSKNQTLLMHLSINSVCKNNTQKQLYGSYGCILQTTEIRQSNLRREIQSSLSELQKSRQQINIQKFKQPKTINQMMGSSQISNVQQNMTIVEKIEFHIELINTLSNFVYKSTQLQYLMEDWDELNFLVYKKFYLQRMKVLNFLKKYPIKNPFCIKRASIETRQVLKALKQNQPQIKIIKTTLQLQNSQIKKNLQVFYNQFSKQKHGQKINLFEYDNFSHWIYKQLWDQIQLFSYSQSHNQSQLEDRICKSLQAGFLISQLNGNFVVPFQDAEIAEHQQRQKVYIDDNLKVFQRYVLNKKK